MPNFGLSWDTNNRRGRMITIRNYKSDIPALAKNLIDQSLGVHGGSLFNLLPWELRNFEGTVEDFKIRLDDFLKHIPDKPQCDGLHPDPVCKISCKNSNSLIDWVSYLNLRDRRKFVDPNDN